MPTNYELWRHMPDEINTEQHYLDSKDHGANMGPTWVLSAPGEPHVGPMNLAIRVVGAKHSHHNEIYAYSGSSIYGRAVKG